MSALVSCIIPACNAERFVREAVASVLSQSHRPLEVIVVDDGSTDGTAAAVAEFGDVIRCIPQLNQGPPAARNHGISKARGELIAFLDADDRWHPEKLARQAALFDARPDLDCCLTHVTMFWSDALGDEETRYRHDGRADGPGWAGSTMMARRRAFEAVGTFDPTLRHSATVDWFARAGERGAVVETLPELLAYRRMHRANMSRLERQDSQEEMLNLVGRTLRRKRTERPA
ncbi:MAG: glycosyltransferase family 2 protein [Gemmatimonadota bacterium]|nr:glycosyltransferase family 2 protein [Gemmatimonadota bacterium]